MRRAEEARLVLAAAAVLLATVTAAFAAGQQHGPLMSCFVGPALAAGSTTRSDPASAASSPGVQPQQHQQRGGTGNRPPPLARRMLLRRALARPKLRTGGGKATAVTAVTAASDSPPPRTAAPDVDGLFRLEVAQRMREMKLLTQPGVGPLAPVTRAAAAAATAAAAGLTETLPSNKLEGDAAALEHQISLLSTRIASIADHLKTTPADAVSRKGLVVLVKRRRRLLQTLRHRDKDRWLATTETLGLRQRPDAPAATTAGWGEARRERRRDRGRRRRRDEEAGRRRR